MKLFYKTRIKQGLPPGTLVHIGEKRSEAPRLTYIRYDEKDAQCQQDITFSEITTQLKEKGVHWINIDGVHDTNLIEEIGNYFKIHPLVLEDIVHTGQRPKIEDYGDYLYVVLKMIYKNRESERVEFEQISVILGKHFVLSFQERKGDVFDPVRERIQSGKGCVRKKEADYLMYALIDAIIDHYFVILEHFGDSIEAMEDTLIDNPKPESLQTLYGIKRELIMLRRSVWPLREVVNTLDRDEFSLIKKETRLYIRDIYDHTIQVIETIETFRDMTTGMLDTYLSSISNKMNEIMKVLTIIATIFIPLTFIAGIYGMNFQHMPELAWKWGYAGVWCIMGIVGTLMIIYFKRKKWL